jgi:hypothetical protein
VSGYNSGCKKRDILLHIITELPVSCDVDLKNYIQMTDECFKVLPHLLKLDIKKQNTRMTRASSAEEILTATLRLLATGRSFEDMKFTVLILPQAHAP